MEQNPIADIADTLTSRHRLSRIPFEELCGFYAALQWGAHPVVVERAAGLTRSTVTHLRNAGSFRSGQLRYPKIRAEFVRLGKHAFADQYLTAPIKDRLRVAKDRLERGALEPKPPTVNPDADAKAGFHALDGFMGPHTVEIGFDRTPGRRGWAWRHKDTGEAWRGDPRDEERRFPNSRDAYLFCRLRFAPKTQAQALSPECEAANDDCQFYGIQIDKPQATGPKIKIKNKQYPDIRD